MARAYVRNFENFGGKILQDPGSELLEGVSDGLGLVRHQPRPDGVDDVTVLPRQRLPLELRIAAENGRREVVVPFVGVAVVVRTEKFNKPSDSLIPKRGF